jgi:hypothetical protein
LHELQQEQNRDPANDLEDKSTDQCQGSILASLDVALTLALNSPHDVLIQNSAANKPGAFALDLDQDPLGLRADDGYVAQINNQFVAIGRLFCLQPRLLQFCDPRLDQFAFQNQLALALAFDGGDS